MNIQPVEIYFIKAKDNYYYNIEETIESLNKALSYDEEHAPSLCLLGCVYFEQLKNYYMAEMYLKRALFYNPKYTDTYYTLIRMYLTTLKLESAEKIIREAKSITGINLAEVLYYEASLYEIKQQFDKSIALMQEAKKMNYNKQYNDFLNEEKDRILTKKNEFEQKDTKKKSDKKNKKK